MDRWRDIIKHRKQDVRDVVRLLKLPESLHMVQCANDRRRRALCLRPLLVECRPLPPLSNRARWNILDTRGCGGYVYRSEYT